MSVGCALTLMKMQEEAVAASRALAIILLAAPVSGARDLQASSPQDAEPARAAPSLPHERPADLPGPGRAAQPVEMPVPRSQFGIPTSVQVNVGPNGGNITGDAANEPSLAVDPTNPNRMSIGWRQFDTIASNFREAGRAFSQDGGRTWHFPGVLDPGVFRSDPVLTYDADGRFFYSSLRVEAGIYSCDVYATSTGGATWELPVYAWGGDKQWITVDRTPSIGRGHLYQIWSTAGSCCGNNIFTRSTDGGFSWDNPVTVPQSPIWGTLDVAPDGTLYASGVDSRNLSRILVSRSTSARDPFALPSFTTVLVNLGGSIGVFLGPGSPNPDGLLGQVWVVADPSGGARTRWVYVLASVDPPGADPLDVMFARSTDGGVTWSAPLRVNDDAGNAWQWFGAMSAAPNGRLDVVWNDTRNTGVANRSELHYATSADGGMTWSASQRLTPEFDSHVGFPNQDKIGDYVHLVSDAVGANLAYPATFNGEQDIWFLRIGDYDCNANGVGDALDIAMGTSSDWNGNGRPDSCEGLQVSDVPPAAPRWSLGANVPNPFNPTTRIPFEAAAAGAVRLRILDIAGRHVRTLDVRARLGPNVLTWDGHDARGLPVASGVYIYQLEAPLVRASRRMVLAR